MTQSNRVRRIGSSLAAVGVLAAATAVISITEEADASTDRRNAAASNADSRIWNLARGADESALLGLLTGDSLNRDLLDTSLRDSLDLFRANFDKRESDRAKKIAEVSQELDDQLAAYDAERNPIALSTALSRAVQLQLLTRKDDAFFADPRIVRLVEEGRRRAAEAERKGDWVIASELYFRLDTLHDPADIYKDDVQRLGKRLAMIRLYAPERLWELRNNRRLAEGMDPLPPYNPFGDDYKAKLNGVNSTMVRTAIQRSAQQHVGRTTRSNPEGVTMNTLIMGGLDAVRTMATTTDLARTFPGIGNESKRNAFIDRIEKRRAEVRGWSRDASAYDLRRMVDGVLSDAQETIGVMPEALLHEFGNGAMAELDVYSAFIWPDELARFRRTTQGEFIGVGIQIQLDELQNITVIAPLEGTPAQRAGIRSGDIIKKIDGITAVGLGLDQAVEVITGPANTSVNLTIERKNDDDKVTEITFELTRQRIDLPTVKGWSKTGPGDHDWNWFIDQGNGVGYIRLTGFTDDSARDFDRAIEAMRQQGLKGLVLDLRYNPGGLLDQAVEIASRFVPGGMIVKTVDAIGVPQEQQNARRIPQRRSLSDLPVVVLINEGSASASEIVAGAVQAAAQRGEANALIVGQRSFGKGSVQNVFMLPGGMAAMKLTTHYYRVDSPRMIDKMPGATEWGVEPDVTVEMLPSQVAEALLLRRDADVLPIDETGRIMTEVERPDPNTLLTEGIDLQVQTALVLLQTQNLPARGITSLTD
ncbi:MAG: S41 family peptidase [Phycisphaerales bacterium]|nr:S41 family peptidase [Planctomycetota bacterium]MCH8507404.1 S41 family peptidase [Phycisphaerales bacterium]